MGDSGGDAPVLTERQGAVLLVVLNRPSVRNAVNRAMAEQISDALDALDSDPSLALGVITGTAPGFCAGMDLKAFAAGELPVAGDRGFAGLVRRGPTKPLVAAVEGFAMAGGLEVALACDIIVSARDARLGISEVKRSLVAVGGALRELPRRMPYGRAMELALTGDEIRAEDGYRFGLVDRLTDPGEARGEALALAERIAANGPLALAATKAVLRRQFDWSDSEFWDRQEELTADVFESEDALEGANSFLEKRAPQWRGR
jgi:enoyl-CoA hydratase